MDGVILVNIDNNLIINIVIVIGFLVRTDAYVNSTGDENTNVESFKVDKV